jgi:hypothetical protein
MNYGKPASGEKFPKGVTSSDKSGQKKGSESGPNSTKITKGMSGEVLPKGATASDTTGERKAKLVGGVAMGKADSIGSRDASHMGKYDGQCGEMKGGSSEKVVYEHKRVDHDQDGM